MFSLDNLSKPISLSGIGLRREHHSLIKETKPPVNWFEILIDNYLDIDSVAYQYLDFIAANYAVAFHSVGMSLGSTDPINFDYLKKIKKAVDFFNPASLSDHMSWSSVQSQYVHDLYPLPFTEEAASVLINNIIKIQDFFGRQILIENISSYLTFEHSEMQEWEFINMVAEKSDCFILLDINNIYVSCTNHGWSPQNYLEKINPLRVKQYHLGGHYNTGKILLDTHGALVSDKVWHLFYDAVKIIGKLPTLIEWDTDVPDFSILQEEAHRAQQVLEENKICCETYS